LTWNLAVPSETTRSRQSRICTARTTSACGGSRRSPRRQTRFTRVVAWELEDQPEPFLEQREHLSVVTELSDAYRLKLGDQDVLVTYLLEVRHAAAVVDLLRSGTDRARWGASGAL